MLALLAKQIATKRPTPSDGETLGYRPPVVA